MCSSFRITWKYCIPVLITIAGYIVVISYFAILNSSINKGQTIGKRIFSIKVIHTNTQHLSLAQSYLRVAILYAPFCLMSFTYIFNSWVHSFFIILLGGLFISTFYLFIFNRHNRRTLHDFLSQTIVVQNAIEPKSILPIWKAHFPILLVILSIYTGTQIFTALQDNQDHIPSQLQSISFEGINSFDYGYIITFDDEGFKHTEHYYIGTITDPNLLNNPFFAKDFAQYIFKLQPSHQSTEHEQENFIQLIARYQFGLISKQISSVYSVYTDDNQIQVQEISATHQTLIGGG